MIAPANDQLSREFNIHNSVMLAMITSVFVLGFGKSTGRARVLQLSNLFFLAWNIGCAFTQNEKQLIAFRFMSGLGGSAPLSIGRGVIQDIYNREQRGEAIAIYSLAPLLGPESSWRWVVGVIRSAILLPCRKSFYHQFWSSSILDVAIQLFGLVFLPFAPVLLKHKAEKMVKQMDLKNGPYKRVVTIYQRDRSWKTVMKTALYRPFLMFAVEPIIQLLGLYMAFVYGLMYLFLTTIPSIFKDVYHEHTGIAGLNYIALGIGLTCTSQINAQLMDKIYFYLKNKNSGPGQPEFRLPPVVPATILLPCGLLIAGWTAHFKGIALVGAGIVLSSQSIQMYIVDAFVLYSASALAAVNCLRALAGFGFPLLAPIMYKKLGFGKGDTILAIVGITIGCPAP
ncbi:major facilitator superfamily domain-containing protein [Crucibulum laeve]|uniref:Major facilitator superfamily domain-containing protein n=1 Tax=Crucibulum laeve TaxID=68775 RepID=A0A5C3LJ66_9AGAR|nr:major facilitator superfamily domain-containing protein [Crucibulum laeve]